MSKILRDFVVVKFVVVYEMLKYFILNECNVINYCKDLGLVLILYCDDC